MEILNILPLYRT